MTPEVSIVIACRDAVLTLGVQLAALSRQECPVSWNVVISDNGSTDGTLALARSFADRLPELTIVDSSDRTGAGHARNVGSRATSAPLLVFCDADDEAAPGWLAAMVQALQRHEFVAGRFEAEKLNSTTARRSRPLQQSSGLQSSPFGPDLPHAGAGNLGIRRDVFLRNGGFDPVVGCLEDTDLCWRIQLAGTPLVFAPDAVMHVRLRSSLRTMWSQGRAYGAASALLTHRYAAVEHPRPPAVAPARAGAARRRLALLRDQRSLGSLLWTAGWHVGHRRWHPPATVSPARPQAADAA